MGRILTAKVSGTPLWEVRATYYSPALGRHAKAVPGIRYDPMSRGWRGYIDAVRAVVARLESEEIIVEGSDELPTADAWKSARTPFLFATGSLREYQVEGVRFLIQKSEEGCLLADSMRLGKSAQATVAARAFKQRTLIVCPPHLVGVWGRPPTAPEGPGEIAKWWPDAWKSAVEGSDLPGVVTLQTVKPHKPTAVLMKLGFALETTEEETAQLLAARDELARFARDLEHANVVVCHYDILYAWVEVLKLWGFRNVIFDEIHICSGYQSRRSKALKEIRAFAKRAIGLTGTPLTNLPKHAHNVLEIISPGRFGFFFAGERPGSYARTFCGSYQTTVGRGEYAKTIWQHDGRTNLDEPDGKYAITKAETLHERFRYFMLRRLKRDVDPQLPTKIRQIVDVTIPPRATIHIVPAMLAPGKAKELRAALDLSADAKFRSVVDLVVNHVAEGEPVFAVCYRRAFARRLAEEVKKKVDDDIAVEYVHGELSQRQRDAIIHKLRGKKGPRVLAGTIDTTSTGIDLSFFTVCVVAELTWEPHELAQCLDAKTEILTPHGFAPMGAIKPGDLVAAFNPQTEEIAYLPATSVIVRDLDPKEEMYAIKGDRLNLRVTGGHRMLLKHQFGGRYTRRWTGWKFELAAETATRSQKYRIPVAGYKRCSGVSLTDDELRVIGWYLTDGTLSGNNLAFSQSTGSRHLVDLEAALRGAGLAYGMQTVPAGTSSQFRRNFDHRVYTVPRFQARGGRGAGWYRLGIYLDKNFSPALFDLTREQLSVLLEAIHWGDGSKEHGRSWSRRTYHIHTGNRTFAERLQRLCIERGFRANLTHRRGEYGGLIYTINVGPHLWRTVEGTTAGRTNLKRCRPKRAQRVWCASNAWGTLVVRRHGQTAIVGNCEERLYKFGSDQKSLVQYVIARGTGDELILRAVISKLDTFERVVGATGDDMKKDLSAQREDPMKRLLVALEDMRAGTEPKTRRRRAPKPSTTNA